MDPLDRAGVTAREREVLALLGERLTNGEIAERLYISVRTVESHVSSLLRKLGADTRRDLVRFASMATLRGFPVPSTSLIGREELLNDIVARMSVSRLVTLSGVAGSGKTRMAIEAGNRMAPDFRHGAVFVDLIPLNNPRFVTAAVAASLGLGGTGLSAPTDDQVVSYLSNRDALLVLDNCEHVIGGAATLVDRVLAECPDVKVLATSRQGFAQPAESLLMVPPLEVPNGGSKPLAEVESVRLLVERAGSVRSDVDLLGEHRDAAASICSRLDGLPLAIELAAVQMAHLTPEDVAAGLDRRFRLLGSHEVEDSPKATLETALDWSYELLSREESTVFNRLGVFTGSFSLEAAEAVCSDAAVGEDHLSQILGSLVWKSMILATPDQDESRFRLLETMRAYAGERLNEVGELHEISSRHSEWFVRRVEEAASHLTRPEADVWLRRLDRDLGNLRAALRWAIDSGESDMASRLMVGLWRYWHMRGDPEEGKGWIAEVLAMGGEDPMTRASTLEAAGGLAYWKADMAEARGYYEEAVGLARAHGSEADVANALYNTITPYAYGVDSDPEIALRNADRAREIFIRLGDEEGVARTNWAWGAAAHAMGRDSEAVVAYEKALTIYETLDDTFMLGWVHRMLGWSLLRLEDFESARSHFDAGISLFDASGDISGVVLHLRDYAEMALAQSDNERALVLAGAVQAIEDESGIGMVGTSENRIEGLERAREALGQERAQELFDEGREMSRNRAIHYAQA